MKWNNIKIEEVKMEIFWVKMFHKRENNSNYSGVIYLQVPLVHWGRKFLPKLG